VCPFCGARKSLQGLDGHCRAVHRCRPDGSPYRPPPGSVAFSQKLEEGHRRKSWADECAATVREVVDAGVALQDLKRVLRPVLHDARGGPEGHGSAAAAQAPSANLDPLANETHTEHVRFGDYAATRHVVYGDSA